MGEGKTRSENAPTEAGGREDRRRACRRRSEGLCCRGGDAARPRRGSRRFGPPGLRGSRFPYGNIIVELVWPRGPDHRWSVVTRRAPPIGPLLCPPTVSRVCGGAGLGPPARRACSGRRRIPPSPRARSTRRWPVGRVGRGGGRALESDPCRQVPCDRRSTVCGRVRGSVSALLRIAGRVLC